MTRLISFLVGWYGKPNKIDCKRTTAVLAVIVFFLCLEVNAGPKIPVDDDGIMMQVLSPKGGIANLTVGATSTSIALPSGAKVVRITATQDCWYKLGDDSVVATTSDVLMLKGVEYISVVGNTHIAAIRDTADGKLNVVEMK